MGAQWLGLGAKYLVLETKVSPKLPFCLSVCKSDLLKVGNCQYTRIGISLEVFGSNRKIKKHEP